MSAKEFWEDDPQLFVSYRTSFINKKKREAEEMDYNCWLQGLYIHDGNSKVMKSLQIMIASMFGEKQKEPLSTYPSRPYSELDKNDEKKEIKQQPREQKYDNFQKGLRYWGRIKKKYLENLEKEESR